LKNDLRLKVAAKDASSSPFHSVIVCEGYFRGLLGALTGSADFQYEKAL
jgi:hypothetical protein